MSPLPFANAAIDADEPASAPSTYRLAELPLWVATTWCHCCAEGADTRRSLQPPLQERQTRLPPSKKSSHWVLTGLLPTMNPFWLGFAVFTHASTEMAPPMFWLGVAT